MFRNWISICIKWLEKRTKPGAPKNAAGTSAAGGLVPPPETHTHTQRQIYNTQIYLSAAHATEFTRYSFLQRLRRWSFRRVCWFSPPTEPYSTPAHACPVPDPHGSRTSAWSCEPLSPCNTHIHNVSSEERKQLAEMFSAIRCVCVCVFYEWDSPHVGKERAGWSWRRARPIGFLIKRRWNRCFGPLTTTIVVVVIWVRCY